MDFKELFKNELPKMCYLCGRSDVELEEDHLPPKCIFPKQYHSRLITVPICDQCHEKRDKDDEYFRDYITLWCGENVPDEVHERRKRSWDRRMSHGIATMRNAIRAWIPLHSGLIVPGYLLKGEMDRINPVLECIASGHHFYRCGETVPECEIQILMTKAPFIHEPNDPEARFWLSLTVPEQVIPKMFKFQFTLFKDGNINKSNWFMEFYDTVQFFVQFSWEKKE